MCGSRRVALAIVAAALAAGPAAGEEPSTGELRVRITGLESDAGDVVIHLAASVRDYEGDTEPFRLVFAPIADRKASWVFRDLPPGAYALRVFHDENRNREIDMQGYGPPAERYGFSNGATGRFGPASWEDARFELPAGVTTEAIELR